MTRMLSIALPLSLYFSAAASAQWPQWGGPNRDFVANAKGIAEKWPESGPKQLWKRELGVGYSGIIIDDGKLYTMYRSSDEKEVVACLESSSGKTAWEHKYDAPPAEGHVMEFTAGPRSTPLLADGKLYTIGVAGIMHCLDAKTGKVHWTHDLWKKFGGSVLNHGYSSSAIAYKDTIIVLVGGTGHSIIAFKKDSGDAVWQKHDYGNSYSSPKIITVDGEDQLVTFMSKQAIGIDPKNGDLKWTYGQENQWDQNISMPIWGDDNVLFVSSPDAGARGLKLTKNGDKTDIKEIWSTKKVQFYHVTAVGVGDMVYGSTGMRAPSFLAAINRKTGELLWRERGFAKANCLYADGKLVILDENGELSLAAPSKEGLKILSKATVLESVAWTVPTLVGKTLYLRDKKNIVALDLG